MTKMANFIDENKQTELVCIPTSVQCVEKAMYAPAVTLIALAISMAMLIMSIASVVLCNKVLNIAQSYVEKLPQPVEAKHE